MADELSDKIQDILKNPELMNMLSSFIGKENDNGVQIEESSQSSIQNMIGNLSSVSDKRITLLNALKPYMRNSRATNIDKAIKMIRLTKLGSILKDL